MPLAELIEVIEADGTRLGQLARAKPDRPVPQYPGWTAKDLITHTAMVHARTNLICETRPVESVKTPRLPEGADPFDWYDANLEAMVHSLRTCDLTLPVWSFTSDRTIGYWMKRMAVETAIHRWDIELAVGAPLPLAPEVAEVALDEFEEMWVARLSDVPALEIEARDIDRTWVLGEGSPDVALAGTASDIYLRLMSRGDFELPSAWEAAVDGLSPPSRP